MLRGQAPGARGADGASGKAGGRPRAAIPLVTAAGRVLEQKKETRGGTQGEKESRTETAREAKWDFKLLFFSTLSVFPFSIFHPNSGPRKQISSSFRGPGGPFSVKLLPSQSIATVFKIALTLHSEYC